MIRRLQLTFRPALFLLLLASPWLGSGSALAQLTTCKAGAVCYYVAIQPIDVCTTSGTGCAPFNTVSSTGSPTTVSSTNPIGFVDSTGKDITRAMWNQIGVDISWAPMKQYNNTSYNSITIGSAAPNFNTLTQQTGISTGTAPTAPLNSSPYALNMFFVTNLSPAAGTTGTLYGYSWIGNNGIAISSNTFASSRFSGPRYDTLAHEIGHNLGLDHADLYNYNCPTTGCAPAKDLMTQGSTRTEPSSTANALSQLGKGQGTGTADQLDCTIASSTQCTNSTTTGTAQQFEVATSNFLRQIVSSTTIGTASTPIGTAAASVATNSTNTATSNKPLDFKTYGPTDSNGGPVSETLIGLTLTIGPNLDFEKKYKVDFFKNIGKSVSYDNGKAGDPDCPLAGTQCLIIKLQGLTSGQILEFTQGILSDATKAEATLCELEAGPTTITYKFSGGLIITSQMTGCGGSSVSANSQMPVNNVYIAPPTTIDPVVFAARNPFAPAYPPCSPGTLGEPIAANGCPVLADRDGDPSFEGGQPGGSPANRCTPSGALSALLHTPGSAWNPTSPTSVTAYVANGTWETSSTGVRVVPIEPAGGVPVGIPTPKPVNSCASNSQTGQTVCVANGAVNSGGAVTDSSVYLFSGTNLTNTLQSSATSYGDFTGGICVNCGVSINEVTNTAVLTIGLSSSASHTGLQFLDLGSNGFPAAVQAGNQVSEGVVWDANRNLILSPNEGRGFDYMGVYDLFDTSSSPTTTPESANPVYLLPGGGAQTTALDSAAEDCSTGIALASNEFRNNLYIADLTQATPTAGGGWTAPQQFVSLPEFSTFSSGISGVAVAPNSQLAIVAGEFGGNQFGVLQLPATSGPGPDSGTSTLNLAGTGTFTFPDYVAASLPNTPNGQPWSQGLDPHTVTAYLSPNDGKAYALMANAPLVICGEATCHSPPTYVAVIDMAKLLAAPRISGTHSVNQQVEGGVDLVGSGIVRYVATGN